MKKKSIYTLACAAVKRAGQHRDTRGDWMAYGFIKGYAAAMRRVKRRGRK
jgi:hypothetical protein